MDDCEGPTTVILGVTIRTLLATTQHPPDGQCHLAPGSVFHLEHTWECPSHHPQQGKGRFEGGAGRGWSEQLKCFATGL